MKRLGATRVIALGFAAVILIGSALLSLPIASQTRVSVGWFDALFTSASAVCVTGLTVRDTGREFSVFGQVVILLLIQTGGLGFMTLATVFFMIMGKRITLRERMLIQESLNESSLSGMVRLIRWVVSMTFAFELAGALVLMTRFAPIFGWGRGAYFAVFHSVSAFCNAGFDLMGGGQSLTSLVSDPIVNITVMALIISGGLGFSVWRDISGFRRGGKLRVHTKVTLWGTLALILAGAAYFMAFEWNNPETLGKLGIGGKLLGSFFQSVTFRTAGFNTVDLASLKTQTKFLSSILMFIGAAPGSTGGGVKLTTMALFMLMAINATRGREECVIYKRTMPRALVQRAITIVAIAFAIVLTGITALLISDGGFELIDIIFEAVSAFATVGVSSLGTANLSAFSRGAIILMMFIGRVGPLTLAIAIARKQSASGAKIQYPEDRLLVG